MTYTKKEQKQHREDLVEALRSGKYKQGKKALRIKGDFYCCLGVACDVSELGEWGELHRDQICYNIQCFSYMGIDGVLPKYVMNYYGFITPKGSHLIHKESLTSLNDKGYSFEQIADIIESEPEGMFK